MKNILGLKSILCGKVWKKETKEILYFIISKSGKEKVNAKKIKGKIILLFY